MPEATDSYCGARHVFAAGAPKGPTFRGARVLARGLKTFVFTDGLSFGDSLALARQQDGRQDSSRLAEAFHQTFNFCLTCRQYACDRCWNPKASACLSCAPDPQLGDVAPEDHPMVGTPIAGSDNGRPAFPGLSATEPVAASAPGAPGARPLQLTENRPERRPQASAIPAWPAVDLPGGTMPVAAEPGKTSHFPVTKPTDQQAWSLWPIADEIAPEMTLTPEEMELVEARLGQADAAQPPAARLVASPELVVFDSSPAPLKMQPTLAEDLAQPADQPSSGVHQVDAASPPRELEPATTVGTPTPPAPWAEGPVGSEPQTSISSGHLLHNRMATLPPLSSLAAPRPEIRQRVSIVARLLGRRASRREAPASVERLATPTRPGQPNGDVWPLPTGWLERPVGTHDRRRTVGAAAEDVEAEGQPSPSAPPAALPMPTADAEPEAPAPLRIEALAPAAHQPEPSVVDARYAAAIRLSAVSGAVVLVGGAGSAASADVPTDQVARSKLQPARDATPPWTTPPTKPAPELKLPDLTPQAPVAPEIAAPEPAAWQEAVRRRAEAVNASPAGMPPGDRSSTPAATPSLSEVPASGAGAWPSGCGAAPPLPWPPLGASWPAHESRGAAWPGPEAPSIPAVVAAQGSGTPILTEMWAQSAEQVLTRGAVRVCHSCALPVSTQARFCRRCGTHQV